MTSANDVLARAAELISEKGWAQGALIGPDGGMCALGAMGEAKSELFDLQHGGRRDHQHAADIYGRAYTLLINEINPDSEGDPWSRMVSVPQWNDSPERSAEEVVLALKNAAGNTDPVRDLPFRIYPAA